MGRIATIIINGKEINVEYEIVLDQGQFLGARVKTESIGQVSRAELYEIVYSVDQIAKAVFEDEETQTKDIAF